MRTTVLLIVVLLLPAASVRGQDMINVSTPLNTAGGSFFENIGFNWSLRGPNWFANFNGMAPPPFGNFDPNSGLRSGVAFGGNGVNGTLGFTFGQGSSRTITSTTPSVTLMDGVPGGITSQTIRPFVTGITPVVGGYPTSSFGTIPSPGQQMGQAIQQAQQADLQQRMFKANRARQTKAIEYFNRGQRAETEGNKKMARANYRLALASAEGLLRVEVIKRMRANGWTR